MKAKSSSDTSRIVALLVLFLICGAAVLVACESPQTSGESHFGVTRAYLRVCEDGICEEGDSCECAVCTVPCAQPADCAERILGAGADPSRLPDNVVCRVPGCQIMSSDEGGGGDSVCEVVCDADSDCAFLDESHDGRPHVCRSGACRTDETPENPSEPMPTADVCPPGRSLLPGIIAPDGIGLCLDITEVSVAAFSACVDVGSCDAPTTGNFLTAGRETHPVNYVTLEQAVAHCAHVSARLPTQEEWRAAIGPDPYPWGPTDPTVDDDPSRVCGLGLSTTCPVGDHPAGSGPYGHDDLLGNVAELVQSDATSCTLGGGFDAAVEDLEAETCTEFTMAADAVGFRCVSDF